MARPCPIRSRHVQIDRRDHDREHRPVRAQDRSRQNEIGPRISSSRFRLAFMSAPAQSCAVASAMSRGSPTNSSAYRLPTSSRGVSRAICVGRAVTLEMRSLIRRSSSKRRDDHGKPSIHAVLKARLIANAPAGLMQLRWQNEDGAALPNTPAAFAYTEFDRDILCRIIRRRTRAEPLSQSCAA
jgi:hypothetical protein